MLVLVPNNRLVVVEPVKEGSKIVFGGLCHGSNRLLAHEQVVVFFELSCELAKQMRPLRRKLFLIIASRVEPVRLRSLVCSVKPSKLTRQFGYAVLMVQEQPVPLPSEPSVKGGVDVADHASSYARVALGERFDCTNPLLGCCDVSTSINTYAPGF